MDKGHRRHWWTVPGCSPTVDSQGHWKRGGEGRARGWAASRFLRHLGELMASLPAAVICPNLATVCSAGLGHADSPFGS